MHDYYTSIAHYFASPFTFHSAFHTLHAFLAILSLANCTVLHSITRHDTKVLILCKTLTVNCAAPVRSSRIFLQRGGAVRQLVACHLGSSALDRLRVAYVQRLGSDEKLEFMKMQMIAADMMRRGGYQACGVVSPPVLNVSVKFTLCACGRVQCGCLECKRVRCHRCNTPLYS